MTEWDESFVHRVLGLLTCASHQQALLCVQPWGPFGGIVCVQIYRLV